MKSQTLGKKINVIGWIILILPLLSGRSEVPRPPELKIRELIQDAIDKYGKITKITLWILI